MEGNCVEFILKNIEFTVPVIVLLGYIAASVQKIVRLAYYKVDIVYLFSLHIAEVFLGVCYLVLLVLPVYSAYLYSYGLWYVCLLSTLCTIALMLAQVYSLKLKINKNFMYTMAAYILYLFLMFYVVGKCINGVIGFISGLSVKVFILYFLIVFMMFVVLIICLQFWAESSNERFTYLEAANGEKFILITVYQGNYITIRSEIDIKSVNNTCKIKLYRGDIVLFPIDNYKINVCFCDEKILLL